MSQKHQRRLSRLSSGAAPSRNRPPRCSQQELRRAFDAKAREVTDVLKMGARSSRRRADDARPGISTYAVMLQEDEER